MSGENFSFPYPILGNGDDVSGDFRWEASIKLSRQQVVISAAITLDNADLNQLIEQGKAQYVIQIQCPLTFYRETFVQDQPKFEIDLPAALFRGNVELAPYVVAKRAIESYAPKSAHKDYRGISFPVSDGGILATGPIAYFLADKEFMGSKRRLRSIMEFVRHTREGATPEIRLGGARIEVHLNSDDWSTYQDVKGSPHARNIIHAAIVFPALLHALENIDNEAYEGAAWRDRLRVLLKEKGVDPEESFEAAMALLRNPISRGLSGLQGLFDSDGEPDDDDEE